MYQLGLARMCGDLLCPVRVTTPGYYTQYVTKKCARWVGGSFVAATVTLVEPREIHLCWTRHNGVRLLGGADSPKGRFEISSK